MNKMKIRKSLGLVLFAGIFTISLGSCKKCQNEGPRARVANNGTKDASVQIKTSGGNTENINNVSTGTSSEFRSYAPGLTTFTVTVDRNIYEKAIQMEECFEYEIAIDANNIITSVHKDRND